MEQGLTHEICVEQTEAIKKVLPQFLRTMPGSYFRQIPQNMQKTHIKGVAAISEQGSDGALSFKLESTNGDSTDVTLINTKAKAGSILKQLNTLPSFEKKNINRIKSFTSNDGAYSINVFTFSPTNVIVGTERGFARSVVSYVEEIKEGKHAANSFAPKFNPLFEGAALDEYLAKCTPEYVANSNPRRFLIQRELYEKVKGSDASAVHIEKYRSYDSPVGGTAAWITVAAANTDTDTLVKATSTLLLSKGLDIWRVHLDRVHDPLNDYEDAAGKAAKGYVTMLRLMITPNPLEPAAVPTEATKLFGPDFNAQLSREIKRAKWYDDSTLQLGLASTSKLGLERAEIITAFSHMLHGPLNKQFPGDFISASSIFKVITSNETLDSYTVEVAQLFLDKFRPGLNKTERELNDRDIANASAKLHDKLLKVKLQPAKAALLKMLDAVNYTLRTNYFMEDRYALSFRMDPRIMFTPEEVERKLASKDLPFGTYFSHGRQFNGFHNRFRDIARGGLRVVTPRDADIRNQESTKHFQEVHDLSYTQQKKNKDITEGGAKGVILVDTPNILVANHDFAKRKSVRAFVDSLLDLICRDETFNKNVVDYYKKDELLYFGPDEQIINADIEYIIARAEKRGYPLPAACMSSKRLDGFNHKEFGVTSEGVVRFLDVALRRNKKINPKTTPFTIKITGGPDGDVAGNLMKILAREYGSNCKIVGIADGFGVAEDPAGLDHGELLRLFNLGLPINNFDASKLSPQGIVMDTEKGGPVAVERRNSMAFRLKTDVFVPGGGRPRTINIDNVRDYLDAEGKPSSSLIVEGANLYNSDEARDALHDFGVSIVKDSSANKCGVVTSSCEILCSMLISKQEFIDNKKELITDVMKRLYQISNAEAELLFDLYERYPDKLHLLSGKISDAINEVTDAITERLESVNPGDPLFEELFPVIKEDFPQKLAELAWNRAKSKLPVQYQKNAIATAIASRLVYREGVHFVQNQPRNRLADRCIEYYLANKKIEELTGKLENGTATKEEVDLSIHYLRRGGARTLLGL